MGMKGGIVQYMFNRERGLKGTSGQRQDFALLLGEEKATLPVKNQVWRFLHEYSCGLKFTVIEVWTFSELCCVTAVWLFSL